MSGGAIRGPRTLLIKADSGLIHSHKKKAGMRIHPSHHQQEGAHAGIDLPLDLADKPIVLGPHDTIQEDDNLACTS